MSQSIPPERRHHITSTTVTSPDTPANRPNSSYTASIQCGWVFTGEITSRRLNRSSRRIFIWFFEFVGGVKLFVWSAHVVLKFFRYRVFPLRDHSLRESVSLNIILYGDYNPVPPYQLWVPPGAHLGNQVSLSGNLTRQAIPGVSRTESQVIPCH